MIALRRLIVTSLVGIVVLALGAPVAPAIQPRIVGGVPIPIAQAPWQVAISASGSLCGGSLINVTWVITAAHCVAGLQPSSISVFHGIEKLSQRSPSNRSAVTSVNIHPNWNGTIFNADIALLELSSPVTLNAGTSLISLPVGVNPGVWPSRGTQAVVSGWGATFFNGQVSDSLMAVTISVLGGPSDATCGRYGSSFQSVDDICAGMPSGGIDTCQGDSGGPLVVTEAGVPLLAGITSVGEECALADFPGIYTRVTTYLSWIQGIVPTPITAPGIPEGVVGVPAMNGVVNVTWQPVNDKGNDTQLTYSVSRVGADSQLSELCTTSETLCQISGLKIGQPVKLVVQARNTQELGSASDPITVTPANAAAPVGALIRTKRLATLAGLNTAQSRSVGLKSTTPAKCRIVNAGVRLRATGNCRVAVTSKSRPGARGVVYIYVR